MSRKLTCRIGLHTWRADYDQEHRQPQRVCSSCGATKVPLINDKTRLNDASGPSALNGGPGIGL